MKWKSEKKDEKNAFQWTRSLPHHTPFPVIEREPHTAHTIHQHLHARTPSSARVKSLFFVYERARGV